jgi:hypothetical protein
MSHVIAEEFPYTSLDVLIASCALVPNAEFVRDKTNFKWYGSWQRDYDEDNAAYRKGIPPHEYGRCEHVIRVRDNDTAYEVGVIKNPEGTGLLFVYDFYGVDGRALQNVVGEGCINIKNAYIAELNRRQYKRQGMQVSVKKQVKDNQLQFQVVGRF